jgi:hypothetical protein
MRYCGQGTHVTIREELLGGCLELHDDWTAAAMVGQQGCESDMTGPLRLWWASKGAKEGRR